MDSADQVPHQPHGHRHSSSSSSSSNHLSLLGHHQPLQHNHNYDGSLDRQAPHFGLASAPADDFYAHSSLTSPVSPLGLPDFDLAYLDSALGLPWLPSSPPPPPLPPPTQLQPPAHAMPPPAVPKDDCASSYCDKDDCSDVCENDDCINNSCTDCNRLCPASAAEPCDLKDCGDAAAACPGSPCLAPCEPCEPCEAPAHCAVSCVDAYCHDAVCQQQACAAQACEAASACTEMDCQDAYRWCPAGTGSGDGHGFDNGLSFHIHNANATRWQQTAEFRHNRGAGHYTDISPGSLSLKTFGYHQPQAQMYGGHGQHMPQVFADGGMMGRGCAADYDPSPSPKRRRVSNSTPVETPEHDGGYSTTPSSVSPTPLPDNLHTSDMSCLWDAGCEQTFGDNTALQDHIRKSHGGSLVDNICLWDGCGLESSDPTSLLDHIKDSHSLHMAHNYVCLWEGCSATFATEDEANSHLHLHMAISDSLCRWDNCNTVVPADVDLVKHVHSEHLHPQQNHNIAPAPRRHITQTPSDTEESRMCEWQDVDAAGTTHTCGQVFATSNELQQHARDVHITALKKRTGYYCRWQSCNRRDKPFSQKGKVERHLQTHTGFKSCTCEVCGKEFSAPQALQQHIRTHTGEKPYKCDVCGKEFAQGSAMTMHKRVHTGERPLQCDYPGCGKRFSESSNLSKHRKSVSPSESRIYITLFVFVTQSGRPAPLRLRRLRPELPPPGPDEAPPEDARRGRRAGARGRAARVSARAPRLPLRKGLADGDGTTSCDRRAGAANVITNWGVANCCDARRSDKRIWI
ncbi:hypothetical protein EDC01DRAFT_628621 [Geopyxis carbonaria]|nr:hypothetical protein EDC01DRAFT_628621 [Geopyxis carbonaria]